MILDPAPPDPSAAATSMLANLGNVLLLACQSLASNPWTLTLFGLSFAMLVVYGVMKRAKHQAHQAYMAPFREHAARGQNIGFRQKAWDAYDNGETTVRPKVKRVSKAERQRFQNRGAYLDKQVADSSPTGPYLREVS